MISDSYSTMMSDLGMRSMLQSNEDLGILLREKRRQEVSSYRSGSAPPTVEGSLNAVGGLFNNVVSEEEELRSDPAYVSYYYSNVNLNPRLPPPLLSKEDWRFAQRLNGNGNGNGNGSGSSGLGGIGDRRKASRGDGDDGRSLFSMQLGIGEKREDNGEWGGDGLIGLPGSRQKSIAEIIQDDMSHTTSVSRHPSRPASRNAFDDNLETSEPHFAHLHQELSSMDALRSGANIQAMSAVGSSASHTYASALGASLSRSSTPDPQLVGRAPSPRIPPVGGGRDKRSVNGPNSLNGISSGMSEATDLVSSLSGMTLSSNNMVDEGKHSRSSFVADGKIELHKTAGLASSSYLKGSSTPTSNGGGSSPSRYQNVDSPNSPFSNYGLSGYGINPASPSMFGNHLGGGNFPPLYENVAAATALGGGLALGPNILAAAAELQNLNRVGNHNGGSALQMPLVDPLYLQYITSPEYAAVQMAALNDPTMDLLGLQKAYFGALLSPQKSHYSLPYLGKSGSLNNGYYGNTAYGLGMPYPGSPMASPLFPNSPIGSGSPVRHADRSLRFPSGMRNSASGVMGSWHSDAGGNRDESFGSSLLDEFKSNKTRCFELSEIAGHVVEFSADQYGSRFIQQKLETASTEEKNMVFHEIMPRALSLMTDVFGNYVIQKFFEHGTASQIRELADQLTSHVLTLSLQMYGCRVIQKAIEVVELVQQTKMVAELDGHVMRCVRDQNGNHVIQKCIECIPEEAIQFIITPFYEQVVILSTHPYGCRVIQRVLEHCSDPKTQNIVMSEILHSVTVLAQDQYGNYVVQHVLEHGKPHERSAIITKLIGQIVQMSQQKFASNVVEKCLSFGTPEERQILVNEMIGSTDENEPLQVMMKDQFANYVVQKVLETCDDQQLELILNRIKVHLNALKKYTYGKHIVARVEKLVAAGERRIGILASYSA